MPIKTEDASRPQLSLSKNGFHYPTVLYWITNSCINRKRYSHKKTTKPPTPNSHSQFPQSPHLFLRREINLPVPQPRSRILLTSTYQPTISAYYLGAQGKGKTYIDPPSSTHNHRSPPPPYSPPPSAHNCTPSQDAFLHTIVSPQFPPMHIQEGY